MNDSNSPLAADLINLLSEAKQEIPDWLPRLGRAGGGGGTRNNGGRRGGGGGWGRGSFGGRDFRRSDDAVNHARAPARRWGDDAKDGDGADTRRAFRAPSDNPAKAIATAKDAGSTRSDAPDRQPSTRDDAW